MPELPDVEVFRRYFNQTALNKNVKDLPVVEGDLLDNTSPRSIKRHLEKHAFESTERHGKYLFAHTDNDRTLVLHFGMTGFLKYFKNKDEQPEHTRLMIDFENGYHLAYDSQRKLGLVGLTADVDKFAEEKELGRDAFDPALDFNSFHDILSEKRGMLKSALMDQKTIAGIGNIYSDEIFFDAGLHPARKVEELSDNQLQSLYSSLRKVLKKAIEAKADPDRMPRTWLLPNREEGRKCPRCDGEIATAKIAGRTSYLCLNHQKTSS